MLTIYKALTQRSAAARSASAFHFARRSMASSSSSDTDKKFYVLRYEYTADILEKRGPFRTEHLANATNLKNEGKLVMAGALADPVDSALFIFHIADKQDIDEFVKQDPYVKNNLVTGHSIREWMVAV